MHCQGACRHAGDVEVPKVAYGCIFRLGAAASTKAFCAARLLENGSLMFYREIKCPDKAPAISTCSQRRRWPECQCAGRKLGQDLLADFMPAELLPIPAPSWQQKLNLNKNVAGFRNLRLSNMAQQSHDSFGDLGSSEDMVPVVGTQNTRILDLGTWGL